jgi:hypothetical protein
VVVSRDRVESPPRVLPRLLKTISWRQDCCQVSHTGVPSMLPSCVLRYLFDRGRDLGAAWGQVFCICGALVESCVCKMVLVLLIVEYLCCRYVFECSAESILASDNSILLSI